MVAPFQGTPTNPPQITKTKQYKTIAKDFLGALSIFRCFIIYRRRMRCVCVWGGGGGGEQCGTVAKGKAGLPYNMP